MAHKFIENNGEKSRVYDSLVIEPRKLNIFGSELALKVVQELARNPACAMDIARQLEEHEQKIYYHLRRLEEAGVIKKIRTEKRYAMTAKIYALVSPTVTAKLHEDGFDEFSEEVSSRSPALENFFHPFVKNGRLDAHIVIGDTYSHGKYDMGSKEGPYVIDLMLLLGKIASEIEFPARKLDTEINDDISRQNLIVIGNAQTNTLVDRLNGSLPLEFDTKDVWGIISKKTGTKYTDPRVGFIVKTPNPLNPEKMLLLIGGVGRRGAQSAVIALTRDIGSIKEEKGAVFHVVYGYDKDSDKIIDSVKFLE